MVRENLKKSGIQIPGKKERMRFLSVEACARGRHIQFEACYEENDREKKAAICIGPEYGTVTRSLLISAAREASSFFDILIVMGFAFESYANENMANIGKMPLIRASMNADLRMADLKPSNDKLFVSFGEPDIDIIKEGDMLRIQIKGIDIFDPVTGETKADEIDDIACWFVDTNYNEESFFVRHAYFCKGMGKKDPYDGLRRELKAEISPEAWGTMYSTISRPFPEPESGFVAVKAINHFGDEVMRIFSIKAAKKREK